VVFTLPAEIAPIAYQNKAVVYDLLSRAAAETLITIAADPKHLGARIGATAVLHSWGSAMTYHPHVHMIVPGGGISLDGTCWVHCKPGFLLPVRVLSRLFRRLVLAALADAHAAGQLAFFGEIEDLRDHDAFAAHLAPLKRKDWFVYSKPPFSGPEAVLAYLARYTYRVAIANSRLITLDERGVTFRYKDYRRNGQARYRTMTLAAGEFIRRFLLHVLPKGFHRIRHYGLLASAGCKANIARANELIGAPIPQVEPPAAHDTADPAATSDHRPPCPCCGGRMVIVEIFARGAALVSPCGLQAPTGHHPPVLNQAVGHGRSGQSAVITGSPLSAIPRKPSPGKLAAAPNPHRRPSPHRFPAGSFFGGFRTPVPFTGSTASRPASETLPGTGRSSTRKTDGAGR
jgi:hypothetical protein